MLLAVPHHSDLDRLLVNLEQWQMPRYQLTNENINGELTYFHALSRVAILIPNIPHIGIMYDGLLQFITVHTGYMIWLTKRLKIMMKHWLILANSSGKFLWDLHTSGKIQPVPLKIPPGKPNRGASALNRWGSMGRSTSIVHHGPTVLSPSLW